VSRQRRQPGRRRRHHGALAGQLAGAHYGVQAIPGRWLKRLDPEVGAAIRSRPRDCSPSRIPGGRLRRYPPSASCECLPPPSTAFSRCNLRLVIGSREFQDAPQALEIDGVHATDRRLFARLAAIEDPEERGQVFHDYLSVKFRLHEWSEHQATARSSRGTATSSFLHSWGADSNGHAGAVLSRGSRAASDCMQPTTTGAGRRSAARERYALDRMRARPRRWAFQCSSICSTRSVRTNCTAAIPRSAG